MTLDRENLILSSINCMRQQVDLYYGIERYTEKVAIQKNILSTVRYNWADILSEHYKYRKKNIDQSKLEKSIFDVVSNVYNAITCKLTTDHANFFEQFGNPNSLVLEILSKFSYENIHSDFISTFLKKEMIWTFAYDFFRELVNFKQRTKITPSTKYQIVYREYVLSTNRRIDILAKSDDTILVIENKIGNCESKNQTLDYRKYVEANFSKYHKRYLFLSPEGDEANDMNFINISYRELYELLKSLPIPRRVKDKNVLSFYLNFLQMTIRRTLMNTKDQTTSYIKRYSHGR